jgi:predicted ATPase
MLPEPYAEPNAVDVARLDAMSRSAPLIVITGPSGVGKSGLALRWAHRERWRFGDGRFYASLRDRPTPEALVPVVAGWVEALGGHAGDMDFCDVIETFRELIVGRRVMVLLDGASSGTRFCRCFQSTRAALRS